MGDYQGDSTLLILLVLFLLLMSGDMGGIKY